MIEDNQNTTLPVTPKPEETSKVENKKEEEPQKEKKSFFKYVRKRWRGLLILLLILICGAMYGWKELAINKMEKQFREDSLQVVSKSQRFINQKDSTYLKLLAYTFSWAIRGEVIRNNMEEVNQYVSALVKQPGFVEILLADNNGKVIVSSNKKYETTNLSDFFAYNYINLTDITVVRHPEDNHVFVTLSPIMNLNAKIGTLLFTFKASKVTF